LVLLCGSVVMMTCCFTCVVLPMSWYVLLWSGCYALVVLDNGLVWQMFLVQHEHHPTTNRHRHHKPDTHTQHIHHTHTTHTRHTHDICMLVLIDVRCGACTVGVCIVSLVRSTWYDPLAC